MARCWPGLCGPSRLLVCKSESNPIERRGGKKDGRIITKRREIKRIRAAGPVRRERRVKKRRVRKGGRE